jgi:hypothetical protein
MSSEVNRCASMGEHMKKINNQRCLIIRLAPSLLFIFFAYGCGQTANTTNAVTDCPTLPPTYDPKVNSTALTQFSLDGNTGDDGSPGGGSTGDGNTGDGNTGDGNTGGTWGLKAGLDKIFGTSCENAQCEAGKSGGHGSENQRSPSEHAAAVKAENVDSDAQQKASNALSPCSGPQNYSKTGVATIGKGPEHNGLPFEPKPTPDPSRRPLPISTPVPQNQQNSFQTLKDLTAPLDRDREPETDPPDAPDAPDGGSNCQLSSRSGAQITGPGCSMDEPLGSQ